MAYSLSGERSYGAARLARPFLALGRWVAEARTAIRRRKALAVLVEMNDYQLWDLGIARGDLSRALRDESFDVTLVSDRRRTIDVWPPR